MYRSRAGDIDPVSLIAYSSTNIYLKHTASMVVLGEKLRLVLRTDQPG
jgi:hypothetical protein